MIGLSPACSAGGTVDKKPVTKAAMAEAAALYEARCAKCHGKTGKGDGPEAAKLDPKPRNFRDFTWQLAVSDRHLDKAIVEGGPAVDKSSKMPANPDLADRPELVAALRQHLRTLVGAQ